MLHPSSQMMTRLSSSLSRLVRDHASHSTRGKQELILCLAFSYRAEKLHRSKPCLLGDEALSRKDFVEF